MPRLLGALLLATLLTACSELPKTDGATFGPFYTPTNFKSTVARLPDDIRRVLVLPISTTGQILAEENLNSLDTAIVTELTRAARFEVITITRDELSTLSGRRQITSVEAIPTSLGLRLFSPTNPYAVDAVLFVDLTAYSPYPPLTVGIRTKLATTRDHQILWSADLIFDAATPAIANSARKHARDIKNNVGPADLSNTILQSPSRFTSYVASTTFSTLPYR